MIKKDKAFTILIQYMYAQEIKLIPWYRLLPVYKGVGRKEWVDFKNAKGYFLKLGSMLQLARPNRCCSVEHRHR